MILFCLCSREHRNTSTWLQRALVLEELSPTLRSTNFSCLFVDPAQVAQYHIVLAQLWVRTLEKGIRESLLSGGGRMGFARTVTKDLSDRDRNSSSALISCAFTSSGWVENSPDPFSRNPLQPQPRTHISRTRGQHAAGHSMALTGAWLSSTWRVKAPPQALLVPCS